MVRPEGQTSQFTRNCDVVLGVRKEDSGIGAALLNGCCQKHDTLDTVDWQPCDGIDLVCSLRLYGLRPESLLLRSGKTAKSMLCGTAAFLDWYIAILLVSSGWLDAMNSDSWRAAFWVLSDRCLTPVRLSNHRDVI